MRSIKGITGGSRNSRRGSINHSAPTLAELSTPVNHKGSKYPLAEKGWISQPCKDKLCSNCHSLRCSHHCHEISAATK